MKKVNLEDGNASLKKVLLMMKYDTSKTLNENKSILEEQGAPKGYNTIVSQDNRRERRSQKITRGLLELQSVEDFTALNIFHRDAVGFELTQLLRNHFGSGDGGYAKAIQDHLKKIGVEMTYEKNAAGVRGSSIRLKVDPVTPKPAEVSTTGSAYEMIKAIEPQATEHSLYGIEGAKIRYANSFSIYLIDPTTNAKRFFGYNLDGKSNGREGNWKIENGKLSTFGEVTGDGTLKPNRQQFVEGPTKEEVKSGTEFLKSGMKGEFVKEVQTVLNALSSEQGNTNFAVGKVDGLFGGKTKKGLQNFQISAGLKSDGVLGKDTYASLFRDKTEPLAVADPGITIPPVSAPTSGVQRAATLPAQNAHVDPQLVLRESLKKNLKTKLVEKTQERENLIVETKIVTNRFKLISEGLVIKTDEDKIRFVETVIQETNYLVSQGYNSQSINEGLFDALGSLLGGSFKATPAVFGEYIAKWLLKTLGVPEGSFISAALITLVGNINIRDYDKLFSDCRYTSNLVADTLIEAYVYQMQMKVKGASEGATGFIVSALRNSVAEYFTEDKDGIIQKLQDKIADFICPKLGKLSNVMSDKTDEIKDKAIA